MVYYLFNDSDKIQLNGHHLELIASSRKVFCNAIYPACGTRSHSPVSTVA
jgi:hypothetical protein